MELSRRALNRATLARQLLLERSGMPVPAAVEHLVGVQAQTPHTWYVGLWSRLADFDADAVGKLLQGRELVRLALMRSTIHLVTAADVARLRPWVQPVLDRDLFRNQTYGKPVADVDVAEVVAAGRQALADVALTNKQLGEILSRRWPQTLPAALVYAVRNQVPLIQVPPRGMWGRSGPIAHTTAEAWLGDRPSPPVDPGAIIRRYLAAFGPASIRDMQTWSGLTKLREVVDPLRSSLVTFRDERGVELFDLPDAPRPDEATPAPPRFLYDFDNALLSFADRSRIVTDAHTRGFQQRGVIPQAVLIDGFTAGAWAVSRGDDGAATLTIRLFDEADARGHEAALTEEGSGLLRLLTREATSHEVVVSGSP